MPDRAAPVVKISNTTAAVSIKRKVAGQSQQVPTCQSRKGHAAGTQFTGIQVTKHQGSFISYCCPARAISIIAQTFRAESPLLSARSRTFKSAHHCLHGWRTSFPEFDSASFGGISCVVMYDAQGYAFFSHYKQNKMRGEVSSAGRSSLQSIYMAVRPCCRRIINSKPSPRSAMCH